MGLTQLCKDRNQLHVIISSTFLGGSVGSGKGDWVGFGGLTCASGGMRGIVMKARQMSLPF